MERFEYDPAKQRRTTGIEWTTATWNPWVGCSIKSAGCKNCYAMNLAVRLGKMGQQVYRETSVTRDGKALWNGEIRRNSESAWKRPSKTRTPSIFFVNSMSDFFHENVPLELQREALDTMANIPRHQFQILTKRPELILPVLETLGRREFPENVWIGATVENHAVKGRVDLIRLVPARIRFLSVEPLLGPVSLDLRGIQWVITGGESGPGARPMEADWVRRVRDDCLALGVPHFFKQYGIPENNPLWKTCPPGKNPTQWVYQNDPQGKGGSKLDGRYWKQMPGEFRVPEYDGELATDEFSKA